MGWLQYNPALRIPTIFLRKPYYLNHETFNFFFIPTYSMSGKSCFISYSHLLYKLDQDFLDRQYISGFFPRWDSDFSNGLDRI